MVLAPFAGISEIYAIYARPNGAMARSGRPQRGLSAGSTQLGQRLSGGASAGLHRSTAHWRGSPRGFPRIVLVYSRCGLLRHARASPRGTPDPPAPEAHPILPRPGVRMGRRGERHGHAPWTSEGRWSDTRPRPPHNAPRLPRGGAGGESERRGIAGDRKADACAGG